VIRHVKVSGEVIRHVLAGALLLGLAATAEAQGPAAGSWEISGGGAVVGGFDLDDRDAELTSNTGTSGGRFTLFNVDGEIKMSYGLLGRIGVYATRRLSLEAGVRWTRPVNSQRISGDTENAPAITAEETLNQYLFEGSALWHFNTASAGASVMPFVYGGAGYLRELHEGDAVVEEGLEIHAGGGLKVWMGARKRVGIRGEAGISIRDGGFGAEDTRRTVPLAAGSFIWVF
jgi:hypothetical protein